MAAASVASARSAPAISSPSAANAAVPSSTASTAPSSADGETTGSQPSSWPTSDSTTSCSTSTISSAQTLPSSSPERGSGDAPSRLRTPYRRSNAVAIASEVNAVDITASARTPGVTTSTTGWS